jgi:Polyketide cyclase / dehydrase and lipid transport
MKNTLRFTFFFVLILVAHRMVATTGDQWELELDKEGIRVYTQLEGVSPYKQVKVTATINAPLEKVMEILTAFSNYNNWMHQVQESYLVNQIDSAYYVFILEDAVWPMQDRYQVSKLNIRQSLTKSQVRFRAVPNIIEKRTDAIQIKQYEGYWELEDRADHQCTLEYVVIQNPGGHVPPWLANLHAVENPFQSVYRLKELAENAKIRP